MDIGTRLKNARESIGYTLEKAAQESGIGVSSISEFENKKREPKFSQLSRLAEVYRKSIEFFLSDKVSPSELMLWRRNPDTAEKKKATEAEFRQLCQQYRRLEVLMHEVKKAELPYATGKAEDFDFAQAEQLAWKARNEFQLGDIPSASLKQTLEEKYYIKIFHLSFAGGAISTVSEEFGPAISLNKESKLWVRNYDLAHELFHLLTWHIFKRNDLQHTEPSMLEEQLANAFASRLLLPTDAIRSRIESAMSKRREVSFLSLDEIAREFGVSLDALMWRLVSLYGKQPADIEKWIEQTKNVPSNRVRRTSDIPDELPERYCSLAIRALRDGRLSLIKFAKYMRISYKQARDYLTEDKDFTDEKISIAVT
ncbi:MAG: XRE family transcriptional regulator [Sedimentisphaerales bacterium]|nr:XRE family transcriptional regulator [Sedimentisphaerales bacterium]